MTVNSFVLQKILQHAFFRLGISLFVYFQLVISLFTSQHNTLHFFCLYRPPPIRRKNLTDSMFTEQLPDLLDYVSNLPGFVCPVGDMNIHFDNPLQSLTKQTLTTLIFITLSKSLISPLTGGVISLTGSLFDLIMTSIENLVLQTHLNQTIIALSPTSMFHVFSLLDMPSIAQVVSIYFFRLSEAH